jgi:hypothetical protein
MAMDYTQAIIDQTRRKARFYPFNRPKFWLKLWFGSVGLILSAYAVAYAARIVFTHREGFYEILSRL